MGFSFHLDYIYVCMCIYDKPSYWEILQKKKTKKNKQKGKINREKFSVKEGISKPITSFFWCCSRPTTKAKGLNQPLFEKDDYYSGRILYITDATPPHIHRGAYHTYTQTSTHTYIYISKNWNRNFLILIPNREYYIPKNSSTSKHVTSLSDNISSFNNTQSPCVICTNRKAMVVAVAANSC